MVPSQPMQSILDVRWSNSRFSSVRMGRTLHVLLVPDYFALHITPPHVTPPLSTETPPVTFTYRDRLNLFLIFYSAAKQENHTILPTQKLTMEIIVRARGTITRPHNQGQCQRPPLSVGKFSVHEIVNDMPQPHQVDH